MSRELTLLSALPRRYDTSFLVSDHSSLRNGGWVWDKLQRFTLLSERKFKYSNNHRYCPHARIATNKTIAITLQVKTGGDSDEDSLFDEDDDSEDDESDDGNRSDDLSKLKLNRSSENITYTFHSAPLIDSAYLI